VSTNAIELRITDRQKEEKLRITRRELSYPNRREGSFSRRFVVFSYHQIG